MGRGTRWSKTRWKKIKASWNVTEGIRSLYVLFFFFFFSFEFLSSFSFSFHPRQLVSQDFTLQSFTRLKTGLLPLHNRCSTFLSRQVKFKIREETCEVEITIYPFLLENIALIVRFSLRYFLLSCSFVPPLFHCLTIDGDDCASYYGWRKGGKKERKKLSFFPLFLVGTETMTERVKYVYIVLGSHFAGLLCKASFSLSLEYRKLRFLRNSEASYLNIWKEEGMRGKKEKLIIITNILFE